MANNFFIDTEEANEQLCFWQEALNTDDLVKVWAYCDRSWDEPGDEPGELSLSFKFYFDKTSDTLKYYGGEIKRVLESQVKRLFDRDRGNDGEDGYAIHYEIEYAIYAIPPKYEIEDITGSSVECASSEEHSGILKDPGFYIDDEDCDWQLIDFIQKELDDTHICGLEVFDDDWQDDDCKSLFLGFYLDATRYDPYEYEESIGCLLEEQLKRVVERDKRAGKIHATDYRISYAVYAPREEYKVEDKGVIYIDFDEAGMICNERVCTY